MKVREALGGGTAVAAYVLAVAGVLAGEPALSERVVRYSLEARLDPVARLVGGRGQIEWRNTGGRPAETLQFHLYMNAFRNSESTFLREIPYRSRYRKRKPEEWGWIELDTLRWGAVDLLPAARFIHPDDDNDQDRTVLEVPLPRTVAAGESIVLEMAFRTKLPRIMARTGYEGKDFFFVAQWFPKLGVWEVEGWNCHQFHRTSEFYADFGSYDVRLMVPIGYVVGATGELVEEAQQDSIRLLHYHADDVHDFAWTASPLYVVYEDSLGGTKIRVLMQRGHRAQARRHLEAAKTALRRFQEWFGPYPYPVLTVVDTKGRAGGMEYPTLITAGVLFGPWVPRGLRTVEAVVFHEFGHQYWYGMVANNEFEEAWLDEGINSYSEVRIFEEEYGPVGNLLDLWGMRLSDLDFQRLQLQMLSSPDPVGRRAWEFVDAASYSVNSYAKVAVTLATLERYVGKERFLRCLRAYFERWRFRHPRGEDFLRVVREELNEPACESLLRQILEKPGRLDYGVARAVSYRQEKPMGVDFQDAARSDSASGLEVGAARDSALFWNEVLVRRYGEFQFPVDIALLFANGDTLRFSWDGQDAWHRIRLYQPSRLVAAVIDPDGRVPLDLNGNNNSRTVEPRMRGVRKLVARWVYWLQVLFSTVSFFS
ncbi:MAG: M1 family metallopeptidase [candidate division KSB1 bacterium]|nr:M1 family metallopeptidase [candidate division KSB1 bacterium]